MLSKAVSKTGSAMLHQQICSFFPSATVNDVIHLAIKDRVNAHHNKDPARGPQVLPGFGTPHTSATVETAAFYDTLSDMHVNAPYAALLDFTGSEENLGTVDFVLPHGGFVTRNSPVKCKRHVIEIGGTCTPGCWISAPHHDYLGGFSPIVHLDGTKLWYWFPRTPHNAKLMDELSVCNDGDFTKNFTMVIKTVENLQWAILDKPVGFIMDSFEYHGCLALDQTLHIGGPAWYASALERNLPQLHIKIDNMMARVNRMKVGKSKDEAVAKFIHLLGDYQDAIDGALGASEILKSEEDRVAMRQGYEMLSTRVQGLLQEYAVL
jgi:hypothetical protein